MYERNGDGVASDAAEAARACLFAVVDRFNTEDPFWGSFVPEIESTRIGDHRFWVALIGRGVRLEVQGVMVRDADRAGSIMPSLVVGAVSQSSDESPRRWHAITCTVDAQGRFVTSNFRRAIESAIEDLKFAARRAG